MSIFGQKDLDKEKMIKESTMIAMVNKLKKELEEAKSSSALAPIKTEVPPEKTFSENNVEQVEITDTPVPEPAEVPAIIEKQPQKISNPASDTANMVLVPAGEFIFGHGDQQKKINLKAFYIDIYEVSNTEYRKFNPRHQFPTGEENFPATGITFFDAKAYAEWRGKRLPAEEEWEKAARGTDGRIYPWGNEFDSKKANVIEAGIYGLVENTGYESGKSPYGCYNMCGNAWEWTSTGIENDEEKHVLKGGSNLNTRNYATTYVKEIEDNLSNYSSIGFRCAKDK